MDVFDWAKSHPWETGGIVFGGGLAILFLLRAFGGGSSQSSGVDPNVAAYLNAEAAQGQAGDALQAIQDQTTAATAQSLINANANVDINNTWASAGVANTESTNTTSTQNSLIAQLGALANNLGTVLTKTSGGTWGGSSGNSSNGFFGLFGGSSSNSYGGSTSSSSQTLVANSEQGAATGLLGQITNSEFNAGS